MYRPAKFDGIADLDLQELQQVAEAQADIPEEFRVGETYLRSAIRTLITTQEQLKQDSVQYIARWSGLVDDVDAPESWSNSNTYLIKYTLDNHPLELSVQLMECFEEGSEPFYAVGLAKGEVGNRSYSEETISKDAYLEAMQKLKSMYDEESL